MSFLRITSNQGGRLPPAQPAAPGKTKKHRLRNWLIGSAATVGAAGGAFYLYVKKQDPFAYQTPTVESGEKYYRRIGHGDLLHTSFPYPLVRAVMDRYPDALGKNWGEFNQKFGTLSQGEDKPPVGFALNHHPVVGLDMLSMTCAFCHDGELNGERVTGIGNRNLRINALDHALWQVFNSNDFQSDVIVEASRAAAKKYDLAWRFPAGLAIGEAVRVIRQKGQERSPLADVIDAGPGRSTHLEFSKTILGVKITEPIGYTKYPALWTFAQRRSFAIDAFIQGDRRYAVASFQINMGMDPNYVVEHPWLWEATHLYLASLKPPPFPQPIDPTLATQGRGIFAELCVKCHGTPGSSEEPYTERPISLSVIGTDRSRFDSATQDLVDARNANLRFDKLNKIMNYQMPRGYVPPPLDGIWSRGPFLHNGAVPSLADLLLPANERPVSFFVGDGTPYDASKRIGIAYSETTRADGKRAGVRQSPGQLLFDTEVPGNGNHGHEGRRFGTNLSPEEKRALLEYLKTL